jgi:hypothetical protein
MSPDMPWHGTPRAVGVRWHVQAHQPKRGSGEAGHNPQDESLAEALAVPWPFLMGAGDAAPQRDSGSPASQHNSPQIGHA